MAQRAREMIGGDRYEMRTADFTARLAPNGQIAVPAEVASQVPPGEQVQVVIHWGASEDDAAWRAAGRRQFEAAYAADDSVYEALVHPDSAS
jgi:hypothetical protein